jgi:hypothetical protein
VQKYQVNFPHLPHQHERSGADRGAGAASRASGIDEVTFSIDGATPEATANAGSAAASTSRFRRWKPWPAERRRPGICRS